MPRSDFDRHLRLLEDDILMLGSMVEKAIASSLDALQRRDFDAAQEVIDGDDHIDNKRFEIEDKCINLIATQQPLATDLRVIIALLHITQELERMGDYAEGVAKIGIAMGDEPPLKPLIDIPRMADKSASMVRRSLDALVNRDVVAAQVVLNDDDEVDALYRAGLPRAPDVHDRGPPHHQAGHLPDMGGPRPGADSRPGHQHRREGHIPGHGPLP